MTWPTITFNRQDHAVARQARGAVAATGPRSHQGRHGGLAARRIACCCRGDLVEFDATPYAGDAYFKDWPQTLDNVAALKPAALVPGRGAALTTPEQVAKGLAGTRDFIADVYSSVQEGVKAGRDLNAVYKDTYARLKPKYSQWVIFDHCMPFDVSRAYDEASGTPTRASGRPNAMWRCGRLSKAKEMTAPRLATACASPPPEREARPPWSGPAAAGVVDYQSMRFEYRRHPDQDADSPARHPVVIVGAGPVGLALAIDLAQQQVPVVLLDNDCTLSTGSRAICFAKRTLEVFDRLGCGDRMVDKGVSWNVGKVFFKDEQVYRFDLLPEPGHERPAFINLQQYYVEGYLAERAAALPLIALRWNNKVVGIEQQAGHAVLTIETPEGSYRLAADYVAACDGSRSNLRQLIGEEPRGRVFRDRFLIADVRMDADLPTERRFWFDPPFHPQQSVLLHKQADGMWRIDFQLGWDADPVAERAPEKIVPRVRALLDSIGHDKVKFDIGWASVYTFACQRMERFRHGRVLFAGDSAHGVSPFGARGANSGVQDADNLAWKLAAVLKREAPDALLDSYASEREYAADENIRNSTRATDFITPRAR